MGQEEEVKISGEPTNPPGESDKGLTEVVGELWNQAARKNTEDEYEEYLKSVGEEAEAEGSAAAQAPASEPKEEAAPPEVTPDTVLPVPAKEPDPASPGVDPDKPRTSFKTLEDADRAYLEARKWGQDAAERAKRAERERDEAVRQSIELATSITQGGRSVATDQGGEGLDQEAKVKALEEKYYEDPIGFLTAFGEVLTNTMEQRMSGKVEAEARRRKVQGVQTATQKYFDDNHGDLKAAESFVIQEIDAIYQTGDVEKITVGKTTVKEKVLAVIDEAARRVREEKIPRLVESMGYKPGGQTIKRERLKPGAPAVVPGGRAGGVVIAPGPTAPAGETNEQYMERRLKAQERFQMVRP